MLRLRLLLAFFIILNYKKNYSLFIYQYTGIPLICFADDSFTIAKFESKKDIEEYFLFVKEFENSRFNFK